MSETTTDAVRGLKARYLDGNAEMQAIYAEERANFEVAIQIRDLREAAGLTQMELAERIGTTASVISRLERASYAGHSMAMLRRIAAALNKRVELRFVDLDAAA